MAGPLTVPPPAQSTGAATIAPARSAGVNGSLTPRPETLALVAGAYITDGCSLLRIEHVHTDCASGATFVELEDCATMELSVCAAESLASQRLRGVVPVEAARRPAVSPTPRESRRAHSRPAVAPR